MFQHKTTLTSTAPISIARASVVLTNVIEQLEEVSSCWEKWSCSLPAFVEGVCVYFLCNIS